MSDGSERVTAWIVSHTHWDREWYLSYGRFRVDLARMVHALLDRLEHDPEFKHFVLDGQALLLRDHLQFYPEDRARIRRLVKEGWLSLGPWYILPDEFLVSGEATVRNLLAGHQLCRELGGEVPFLVCFPEPRIFVALCIARELLEVGQKLLARNGTDHSLRITEIDQFIEWHSLF